METAFYDDKILMSVHLCTNREDFFVTYKDTTVDVGLSENQVDHLADVINESGFVNELFSLISKYEKIEKKNRLKIVR